MTKELESAPKAPDVETLEELTEYIKTKLEENHDYGSSADALWLTALATFKLVAKELGVTVFQASYADLKFLSEARRLNEPFAIVKASQFMYPQYDNKLSEMGESWRNWLSEEAKKRIAELNGDYSTVHPDVLQRWVALANNT